MRRLSLFVGIILLLSGCGSEYKPVSQPSKTPIIESSPSPTKKIESNSSSPSPSPKATPEPSKAQKTRAEEIKEGAEEIVNQTVNSGVEISKIEINENMGTDKEDDYIALLFLKFTVSNSAKTTKQVLDLYSSEIGLKMQDLESVDDITIFWESSYLKKDENIIKISFTRNGKGILEYSDLWYSPLFD